MGTNGLSLFDGGKAQSLSIQIGLGADGFSFFDGFHCSEFISTKFCTKFSDSPLPVGVYGCFGGQQLLKGFVGICMELHCIHQGSDALRSRGHCDGRDAGGDSL